MMIMSDDKQIGNFIHEKIGSLKRQIWVHYHDWFAISAYQSDQ